MGNDDIQMELRAKGSKESQDTNPSSSFVIDTHSNHSTTTLPTAALASSSTRAPGPPPPGPPSFDTGLVAWLQCLGAFVIFFNTWGLVNTFGVYQAYYERELLLGESSSNISWIGSIQTSLLMFGSLVAGPLFDRGYLRTLVIVGSFLIVFGMMMTSLSTEYWHLILCQGFLVGIGHGCLFIPSVAIIPTYFQAKRALAMGIAASGSSVGGVIYPIVFHRLEPHIGFGWATRVIAFIMLGTQFIPVAVMKIRALPPVARKLFDASAWKEGPYAVFGLSLFFGFIGLYIPFFYIQVYGISQNIVTGELLFYLLPILNAASFFGRLIPNAIADKAGPLNTMAFCTFMSAVLGLCWIAVDSEASIVVFCVLYGFFSGSFVSLSPTVAATALCPDMRVLGVRIGMLSVCIAIGVLIGNPIAGAIVDDGWLGLQAFCGAAISVSVFCMVVTRALKVLSGSKWKV